MQGQIFVPEMGAIAELVVKKSRFIGQLLPITNEGHAFAGLDAARSSHKGASHHCYAYTFGWRQDTERYSDAGEPSGTAGRPILETLHQRGLRNSLLVVTRYFGGTLLGASGLVHAYRDTALGVIDTASLLKCEERIQVHVQCDYSAFGKLEYLLSANGMPPRNTVFEAAVNFSLWLNPEDSEAMIFRITDLTAGQATIHSEPSKLVGVRDSGEIVALDELGDG